VAVEAAERVVRRMYASALKSWGSWRERRRRRLSGRGGGWLFRAAVCRSWRRHALLHSCTTAAGMSRGRSSVPTKRSNRASTPRWRTYRGARAPPRELRP
jgi:hypothetical protein